MAKTKSTSKKKSKKKETTEERFELDLIARGEAVEIKPGESMPAGATHVVVGTADGKKKIKRKRFSAC